ncbi:MAG: DUF58 domain-containing protein [Thermogutta sp.]
MGVKQQIKVHLTRLGRYYAILAAGIFLAAMVRQVNLLLLLAALVSAPLFFSWFLARRNLMGIRVRRRLPQRISAGDLLVVEIEAERTAGYGQNWLITLTDRISRAGDPSNLPRNDTDSGPHVTFFSLLHGQKHIAAYRGRLLERGKYVFGPIRVSTRFPLGLLEVSLDIPEERTVLVYPRLGILNLPPFHRSHFNHEGQTRFERRSDRVSGDFYGLRQWRPGDSPRLVHWRSSLRHNELLVKQFDRPRHRDVVVGLILWVPETPNHEDFQRAEKAVSFAATLVHDLCRQGGNHISLGVAGKTTEWVSGAASPGFRDRALELLALASVGFRGEVESFVSEIRRRASAESDVIIVTCQPQELSQVAILGLVRPEEQVKSTRSLQQLRDDRPIVRRGQVATYSAASKDFHLVFSDQSPGEASSS